MFKLSPSSSRRLLVPLLVGIVYYLTGKWGLHLAIVHNNVTAVWPPTGVALAALLLFGTQAWPGIFIGAFIVNWTTPTPLFLSLCIAIGNTLEALAGNYWVRRFAGGIRAVEHVRSLFKMAIGAALGSTMISATIGVASLIIIGHQPWSIGRALWTTWWMGDAGGDLIWAPFLLLWANNHRWDWKKTPEALALLASVVLLGITLFGNHTWQVHYPLEFLCIPPLIWGASRFDSRVVATLLALMSITAAYGTIHGHGPFIVADAGASLILAQVFTGVISITMLAMAILISEQRRVEAELREARVQLERRVAEGTSTLSHVVESLEVEVTKHRETGEALRISEGRFKRLVNANIIGFMIVDLAGNILEANDAFLKMMGYSRADLNAKVIGGSQMTPIEYRAIDEWAMRCLHDNGFCPPIEKEYLRKNGSRIPVLVGSVLMEDAEPYCVCFVVDITERRQAQTALRKSYDELEWRIQERTKELSAANSRLENEIARREEIEEVLRTLSTHDALTNLHNRRGFLALAEQHLATAKRTQRGFLLFFADLDHLKEINDTLGHTQGDRAIIEGANALRATFREADIVARMGGDEYAVVATDSTPHDETIYRDRLAAQIGTINAGAARRYRLSLSLGVSYFDPASPSTIENLLNRADENLYKYKETGHAQMKNIIL